MPSRLVSLASANITGVENSSPSSLMVVLPTSTGTSLPSAVSEGRDLTPQDLLEFVQPELLGGAFLVAEALLKSPEFGK